MANETSPADPAFSVWTIKELADVLDMHGAGYASEFQPGGKIHTLLIRERGWPLDRANELAAAIRTVWKSV